MARSLIFSSTGGICRLGILINEERLGWIPIQRHRRAVQLLLFIFCIDMGQGILPVGVSAFSAFGIQ